MLYNKNSVRKTNDKKILHKVGKQWKVVSVALLMAIGGGAAVAATNNASANADSTNYNTGVTATTSTEAQSLEASGNYANPYANAPKSSSVAPSASAKAPSFENINYAPSARVDGNNASAASEKNNENFDKANINFYGPIVKSYVNSINARFPEARSLATDYNEASGSAANDQSLSGSYEATAKNSETANVIASKAAHDGVTASYYTDSVAYAVLGQNGYMNTVSNDASLATQESVVASGASLVSAIDADPVLSAEYRDKWDLASASADADLQYSAADSSIAADVKANSIANRNDLVSAKSTYSALSLKADIAGINSVVDANTVKSLASGAGFSFTSSVVSSAVSEMADFFATDNNYYGSSVSNNVNWSNTSSNANGSEVYYDANNNIVFSAANQTSGNKSSSASAGIMQSANTLLSTMSDNAHYATNAGENKSAYQSASTAYALYQVVSDTAAQSTFASQAPTLVSEINKDSSALNSYTNAVSSANSTSTSASIKASASVSAENAASYLAGNGSDNSVLLSNIFGSNRSEVDDYSLSSAGNPSVSANSTTSNGSATTKLTGDYLTGNNNAIQVTVGLSTTTPSVESVSATSVQAASFGKLVKSTGSTWNYYISVAPSDYFDNSKAVASSNFVYNKDNGTMTGSASVSTSDKGDITSVTALNTHNQYSDVAVNAIINNGSLSAVGSVYATSSAANGSFTANNGSYIYVQSVGSNNYYDANAKDVSMGSVSASVNGQKPVPGYANIGLFDANPNDAHNFAAASAALTNATDILNPNNSSAISNVAKAASVAGSTYNSESSASASYALSADQDVTIASQFANYYGSLESSDADKAASAKSNLNSFYAGHADNQSDFDNANAVFNSASAAEPNDADLAHAFGINVLNHSPKYIVLSHNAMLHSDPNYTKSNGIEAVKAGATFTVEGVGFDQVGNVRYRVATKNGKPAFVTANDYYTANAYLEPGATYDVTLSHNALEHTDLNYGKGKVAKKATAGTTFKNVTAVRADNNYEGITRLQLANGNYITANKYYLTNVQEVANNSNNNSNVQYGRVTF